MKITLSTIMRDGEPYVEYACRSTFPYCDKIVICDTGSKDNTPDIIRQVAKEFDKELVLLSTKWRGYGPARELCMSHIEDGWLWKIGHDEIWFQEKAATMRKQLTDFWNWKEDFDCPYLYPTEYTMEGSHITRQGQMNCRSQFYRIENKKYVYTWGNMTTNDDLTRINRYDRRDQLFLGPLCGDVNTCNQDSRFTAFVNPEVEDHGTSLNIKVYNWKKPHVSPDSIHFAKCSPKRIECKTQSYRQIVPTWPEEGMADPKTQVPYLGPWPEVLSCDGKFADFLRNDIERAVEITGKDIVVMYSAGAKDYRITESEHEVKKLRI